MLYDYKSLDEQMITSYYRSGN